MAGPTRADCSDNLNPGDHNDVVPVALGEIEHSFGLTSWRPARLDSGIPGNLRPVRGASCTTNTLSSLARRMLRSGSFQENDMPDRKDTFDDGKTALRSIKDSLTSGAHELRAGIGRAGETTRDTVKAISETAHGAAIDSAAHIKEGFEAAQDEVEEGLAAAGDDLEEAAETGKAAWTEAADAVREVSRDALASARDTLTDVQEEVREYVRAKPLGALAVAGAVGFALAFLLRRSR